MLLFGRTYSTSNVTILREISLKKFHLYPSAEMPQMPNNQSPLPLCTSSHRPTQKNTGGAKALGHQDYGAVSWGSSTACSPSISASSWLEGLLTAAGGAFAGMFWGMVDALVCGG